jgi:SAM-dependent methyltransferase
MDAEGGRSTLDFVDGAIRTICEHGDATDRRSVRVLDFGCGAGTLVRGLLDRDYDAYGCDVAGEYTRMLDVGEERIGMIVPVPYRLPYPDDHFDVVLSTSVLEHAQNKEECFREIHRVLKPGGSSFHILPSKWYLPREPHIFVPLANFLWPDVPLWYLQIWARLGIRNSFQVGKPWREVARLNYEYCQRGLSYWSHGELIRLSKEVFGNYSCPMDYFIEHSDGGAAALCRKLPFRPLTSWLVSRLRMFFIVSRKQPARAR